MRVFIVAALLTLAAGCAVRSSYAPELVYVGPGVQVIADFDEPIFYADNFYWRFYGGVWSRSPRYNGGWIYAQPPPVIVRIERPQAYVHYRPSGWVARREPRPAEPIRPPPPAPVAPQPQPQVAPQPRAMPQPQAAPQPRAMRQPPAPQPRKVSPPPPQAAPARAPGRAEPPPHAAPGQQRER